MHPIIMRLIYGSDMVLSSLVTGFETDNSGFIFEKPGLKPVSTRNRDSKPVMAKPGLKPGLAIVLTYPQTRVTEDDSF